MDARNPSSVRPPERESAFATLVLEGIPVRPSPAHRSPLRSPPAADGRISHAELRELLREFWAPRRSVP